VIRPIVPLAVNKILPADFAHAEACEGIHSPASPGQCRTYWSVSPSDRGFGPDSLPPPSKGIADLCRERTDSVSCHCQPFMRGPSKMCWLTPMFHFSSILSNDTSNTRIVNMRNCISPAVLCEEISSEDPVVRDTVLMGRSSVSSIVQGLDDRLVNAPFSPAA